jgi:hypothetical protein
LQCVVHAGKQGSAVDSNVREKSGQVESMQALNNKLVVTIATLSTTLLMLMLYHQFNQHSAHSQLSNYLLTYLLNTLETPMFSDESGIVNDSESIINVGEKINVALQQVRTEKLLMLILKK